MNYTEQLIDFVDGNLEPEAEENLFYQLTVNEDMRVKLKKLLAVDNSIHNNFKRFEPGPELTSGVFSALGFSSLADGAPGTGSSSVAPKPFNVGKFFTSNIKLLFTAVVSSVLTSLIFAVYIIPERDGNAAITGTQESHAVQSAATTAVNRIPVITSYENNDDGNRRVTAGSDEGDDSQYGLKAPDGSISGSRSNGLASNTSTQPKQGFKRTSSHSSQNRTSVVNHPSNTGSVTIADNRPDGYENDNNIAPAVTEKQMAGQGTALIDKSQIVSPGPGFSSTPVLGLPPQIPGLGQLFSFASGLGITIELNGMTDFQDLPDKQLKFDNTQSLNNTSISLGYRLSDDFTAGVNYSRETFNQHFSGREKDGRAFVIDQRPNMGTYSMFLRYYPFNGIAVNPYVQLSCGWSRQNSGGRLAGITPRATLGAEYPLPFIGNLFVYGSLDYTWLIYKYQDNVNLDSKKFDINYGLKYRF